MENDNNTFQIDVDVPVTPISRTSRGSKYPFPDMEEGDSFVVSATEVKKIRAAAAAYKTSHEDFNYTVRQVGDGEYRCWRIPA